MQARLGALRVVLGWHSKKKENDMPKAVYKSGDKEYVIRYEDRIWLGRMIAGETTGVPSQQEMQAILWALMNRFMLVPAQRSKKTLVEMIRSFSQPVNPRWDGIPDNQEGQDFCAPGGRYEGTEHCAPARLKRREETTNLRWEELHPTIRDAVLRFEQGNLPYPHKAGSQRLTNWASYKGVEDKFPWGVNIGGNWFFEDKAAIDSLAVVASVGGRTLTTLVGVAAIAGVSALLGALLAGKV